MKSPPRFSHNWWARLLRAPFYLVFGRPSVKPFWPGWTDWFIYRAARWLEGHTMPKLKCAGLPRCRFGSSSPRHTLVCPVGEEAMRFGTLRGTKWGADLIVTPPAHCDRKFEAFGHTFGCVKTFEHEGEAEPDSCCSGEVCECHGAPVTVTAEELVEFANANGLTFDEDPRTHVCPRSN